MTLPRPFVWRILILSLLSLPVTSLVLHAQLTQRVPQWQIDAGGRMSFGVASVKLNKSSDPPHWNIALGPGDFMRPVGGLFQASNMPLASYIVFAYKVSGDMRYLMPGLPDWIYSEHFDIEARAEGSPTKDQFRLMVQSLLAERFHLAMHHEMREVPVFALVLSKTGKTGPQMILHSDEATCTPMAQFAVWPAPPLPVRPAQRGDALSILPELPCGAFAVLQPKAPGWIRMGARKISLQLLASQQLSGADYLDRPVVDRTGLTGAFDLWYEWMPRYNELAGSLQERTGPSLQEALQEQLGLSLKAQKAVMDVMVVDTLTHPSEN